MINSFHQILLDRVEQRIKELKECGNEEDVKIFVSAFGLDCLSDTRKAAIIKLYNDRMLVRNIALKCCVSEQTVMRVCKDAGLKRHGVC